jgi:hypothetical protein
MHLKYRLAALAAALSFSVFAPGQSAAQEKVLNVVPHSNLAILDPIWTRFLPPMRRIKSSLK